MNMDIAMPMAMASSLRQLFVFVVFFGFLFHLSYVVLGKDEDNNSRILDALNAYRNQTKLPPFTENPNADCFAAQLAGELQDQPCSGADDFSREIGTDPKISDFHRLFRNCHIDSSSTVDGVVLPVCVPKLNSGDVVGNFTRSDYGKYLNDRKFSGAGVGTRDDWVVVVLSTKTAAGNFTSGGGALLAGVGGLYGLMVGFLVVGMFVSLL